MERPRATRWWAFVCAFALTRAVATQAPAWVSRFEPVRPTEPEPAPPPAVLDPRSAPPRELRRLPGIGEARAIAIARLRWERGGAPLYLGEVPGVGPGTVAAVRAWLEERGWTPPPAAERAHGSGP